MVLEWIENISLLHTLVYWVHDRNFNNLKYQRNIPLCSAKDKKQINQILF